MCIRDRDDAEHFLPKYQWIYRLFSAAPDQHFPSQKLHFIPIPTSIPRHRWIKTTLRIQHLGGMNTERRLSRFNKYLEADPHRTYQADYAQFFVSWPSEDDLRRWQPRPESVPVLLESNADDAGGEPHGDTTGAIPSLSVIVFAQNDERTITRTVASVIHQEVAEPFEVILVTSGNDQTASIVRERFPTVTVIELPKPALPGEARNAGLAVARGRFVEFPESNVELLPGYLAASLRAHRRGYAMVTGLVTNGTPTPAGWAAYFLDHAEKLPGHDPAEFNGAPGRCSYARLPLLEVGGFPEAVRTGEDTAVNRALARRGYVAVRDPEVQLIHFNRCATPPQLLRHHFRRGRGWGRMVVAEYRDRGHLLNRKLIRTRLIESVPKRLRRIERSVSFARADIIAEHRRHQGLIVLGAVATWVGMWYEILRPTPGKLSVLLGRPVLNVLMVGCGGDRDIALVQVDEVSGKITRQIVSPGVLVPHDGELVPLTELFKLDHSQLHQTIRQVAGKALRIPYLECIIDPRSELQGKSSPPNGYIVPKETLPARLLEAAVTTILYT